MNVEAKVKATEGLVYTDLEAPGFRRRRCGRGFTYLAPDGGRVADADQLERLKSLVIPPAWDDVWISPNPRGHIQATGRDARCRKQYIYHPRWMEVSSRQKFEQLAGFGSELSGIRRQAEQDLRQRQWSRRKVTALVIQLLDQTLIRIGNTAYEAQNDSYGLTTLNQDHVEVEGATIRFSFRGKSGRERRLDIRSRRLAGLVRRCEALPGQKLFQYREEGGALQVLESDDVNEYLQEVTGQGFTAKDFRTWGATVMAGEILAAMEVPETASQRKKAVTRGIRQVASALGNTPAVCRKYYIHPAVFDAFQEKCLPSLFHRAREKTVNGLPELREAERAILLLLVDPEVSN